MRRLLEEYLSKIEKTNAKILSVQDKILAPLRAQDIAHSHKMGLTKHIQQRIDKIDVEQKRLAKQNTELSDIYDIEDFRNLRTAVKSLFNFSKLGISLELLRS